MSDLTDLPSDLAGLLLAIASSPAEDTVRLALADYLREHGQEKRGDFISVQVELARVKGTQDPNCKRAADQLRILGRPGEAHGYVEVKTLRPVPCTDCWAGLRRRERKLWKANAYDWLRNWTGAEQLAVEPNAAVAFSTMPPGSTKYEVRRGFLSKVICSWADAASHLDSILADPWVPGLDEVELTTEPVWDEANRITDRIARRFTATVAGKQITVPISVEAAEAYPMGLVAIHATARLLDARWPSVRSWKLPPEPRDEPPANYNYASAYAANAARRGR